MIERVWELRARLAARRRRLLAWNVLVPAVLLAPVAFSPAAAPHRAAVYAVFLAFFGLFGAGIPLVRDGESGWVETVRLTGLSPRTWFLGRISAEAALDLAVLLPTVVLLAGASGARPPVLLAVVLPGLAAGLLMVNLAGGLVAGLVRSMAEAALACAAAGLALLHLAGTFRTPAPGTVWATLERWSPLLPLRRAADALAAGTASGPALPLPEAPAVLLLALAGGALVAAPLADRLARSGS